MDHRKALISVIIPVYNVADYLRKCVQSVLDNTYRDLEVICIDDGSTDQSGEILDQMAADDCRMIVIHQKNAGVSVARNRGLQAAGGQLIAFIDSDDFIHPQYFASMLSCMEHREASLVVCGYRKFDETEIISPVRYKTIHYKRLSRENFFDNLTARNMIWARLYRREDIGDLSFSPEVRISDDTLFNLSVISNIKDIKVYATEVPLYYYLNRGTSITHSSKDEKFLDFGKWYARNCSLVEKGDWNCLVCLEAVKLTLAYRYLTSFYKDADFRRNESDGLIRLWMRKINRSGQLRPTLKVAHTLMYLFPELYRRYRIMDDPTMKDWETKQRKAADRRIEADNDQRYSSDL